MTRFLKWLGAGLFLLLTAPCAMAGFFDVVHTLSSRQEKLSAVKQIYFEKIHHLSSAQTFAAYRELMALADNEPVLKAYAELIPAKYYSSDAFLKVTEAFRYFDKAREIATAAQLPEVEAEVDNLTGWAYYWSKNYELAFEYFIKAHNAAKKMDRTSFTAAGKYIYDLGFLYYDFGEFKKAKDILLEAVQYPFVVKSAAVDYYNTLGLAYRELKAYDSALFYFKQTIELAKAQHDSAWIGIVTGNMAFIYHVQKKYDLAVPMLLTDYAMSRKNADWSSLAGCLTSLGIIYINQHKTDLAIKVVQEMDTIVKKADGLVVYWNYYVVKARLCFLVKDYYNAYRYQDSAGRYYEKVMSRNDARLFTQAEQKTAIEKHLADLQLLEATRDKQLIIRNTIIICALLLLVIAGQFLHRQRIMQKRNLELYQHARAQLTHYIESIRDKNLLIDNFKQEIERLNSLPDSPVQVEKEEIIHKLQHSTILTDDDWDEFRHLFDKAHKGFFVKLKLQYPNLTNAEMRLMALTKLNLSRREMAEMLGISPDSIKKTSQRIRKKLNLSEDESIDGLVLKL